MSYYALEENKVGEIWIHSESKAAGYYQKPTESLHDFHAKLAGVDGDTDPNLEYLRTGDLGFLHHGELFLCGRLKDLIIIGGRNYYPQDIEATAEATLTDTKVRYGCSAAFTINPTPNTNTTPNGGGEGSPNSSGAGGEEVALIMELRDVPSSSGGDVNQICQKLADQVRSAITQEHSLGITSIVFLKPKTVPKTSSGKIARSWCRKGYINKTLQVVYEKTYVTNSNHQGSISAPLEIEQDNPSSNDNDGVVADATCGSSTSKANKLNAAQMRALSKEDILKRLQQDIENVASIPPGDTIDPKATLSTIMDSITISQFKGMFEGNYHVQQLSDEYLLRDTTTLIKLTEIVKLGYAPDDNQNNNANNTNDIENPANNTNNSSSGGGGSGGLAGAMGCPPGVVCVIL
jgi:AMP-binding enzyme